MKCLEESKKFFFAKGKPFLEKEFPFLLDKIAVGLVGHGSECFGYDDEISADHDYSVGFDIFLTDEDEKKYGFPLERAYSKLVKENGRTVRHSRYGEGERGVKTINGFYSFYVGEKMPSSLADWLYIPDGYLAEAVNGEVFYDRLGEFSKRRELLKKGYPEDIRLKKLASCLFYAAQSGQYNYKRSLSRGENASAGLARSIFSENAAKAFYHINRAYPPYYKWLFKGLEELPFKGKDARALFEELATLAVGNERVEKIIEDVAKMLAELVSYDGLTQTKADYLEPIAEDVNARIKNPSLRNAPIML